MLQGPPRPKTPSPEPDLHKRAEYGLLNNIGRLNQRWDKFPEAQAVLLLRKAGSTAGPRLYGAPSAAIAKLKSAACSTEGRT